MVTHQLFESNLRGTHGTNPHQYPSSACQVKWPRPLSCLEQLVKCL
jgi:hypothetical protein